MEALPERSQRFVELRHKKLGYPDVQEPIVRDWDRPFLNYEPAYYTAASVLKAVERGLAPPEQPNWAELAFISYEGEVRRDEVGRPLNPLGRTGIEGRGRLRQWGPNFATDALLTRMGNDGRVEVLVIVRGDTGQLALPGGFIDGNEDPETAATRELREETGISFDLNGSEELTRGAAHSLRNTDNAWVETSVHHAHLVGKDAQVEPVAGDDARSARWQALDDVDTQMMSDSHGEYMKILKQRLGL